MGKVIHYTGLAIIVFTLTSCGDVIRNSRAPVQLVVNSLQAAPGNKPTQLGGNLLSSVITNVTSPPPCSTTQPCQTVFNDVGSVILSFVMKDPLVQPSPSNAVTITRYHVEYTRADGRNTPGVDVPYPFDGAATATIQANAQTTIGFEIVRHVAKEESPLVQLITNPAVISTIARVTFYGADMVGNAVSVTGSILVDFGSFPNS